MRSLTWKYKLILLFFALNLNCKGNKIILSNDASVSLLTCDEGAEIYSLFGHSAIRIVDAIQQIDEVYNWGMFEFSEDQLEFGYKFAKGRLKYYMAIQSFDHFMGEYIYFKRGVREQVLYLNKKEKQLLFNALQINYLPENRYYKYDFFYDNCSSRIRDILIEILGNKLVLGNNKYSGKKTFREIIDVNLTPQPWLDLGIDLVLGKKIDVMASNYHMMFLPLYLEEILDSSIIKMPNGENIPLVTTKSTLIKTTLIPEKISKWIGYYFWTVLAVTILLFILKIKYVFPIWFGCILFICGILGSLLIFMWLGTNHQATKINYNLLWANPFHIITFISLFSSNLIIRLKYYYLGIAILLFGTVLFWIIIPQEFHYATRPLILSLTIIYYFLFYKSKKLILTSH